MLRTLLVLAGVVVLCVLLSGAVLWMIEHTPWLLMGWVVLTWLVTFWYWEKEEED